ncbi:eukaryotic rRNA processing protein EBP2-domain-containing protein [Thelephora terrestris]|uniref:Eukaryotic rRNA processing protein EBP2-domain-containing protein n=1 Tax=Thelephora terrestris TaxID=56493 RepID=A0A9P6L4N8_9AGAM|nr:eukaryotic rRNA processing protein EBP2-domain-containing protein [Thelephora terrestris]
MSPITLAKKTGKKPSLKPVEKKKPLPPPEPTGNSSSDDEEGWTDEDSEDDGGSGEGDDGVDEVGFEKLIKALGDDGLDDYDQANLAALAREEEDEESGEGEEAEGSAKGLKEVSGHEEGEEVPEVCDEAEEGGSGSVAGTEEGESSGDESVLALDELEDVELHPDAVPRRGVKVIDQKDALERIRKTIQLDPKLPWTETLVLSYPEAHTVDHEDDLNRELAFYKQALHSAQEARALALKLKFPFTRPADYFAEMVKSDSHMERIRQRLLNESAEIKRSEDKRKERQNKKYGKQIQVEKQKDRERAKKDMDDKIKGLKRKRKGALDNAQADGEDFDVAVEDAISDRPAKRAKGSGDSNRPKMSRKARDGKFGFGSAGRRAKQNTKSSTDDFEPGRRSGPGQKFGKGGKDGKKAPQKRPGKTKRINARTRK